MHILDIGRIPCTHDIGSMNLVVPGSQDEALHLQLEDVQTKLKDTDATELSAQLQSKRLQLQALQSKLHHLQVSCVASVLGSCGKFGGDASDAGSSSRISSCSRLTIFKSI